jgi:hypothetical protein
MGPKIDASSPKKSPKKRVDPALILDAPPKLELGLGLDGSRSANTAVDEKGWL